MAKDNPMDKLEYKEPKVVDLLAEQKDIQGAVGWCANGTADATSCELGSGALLSCGGGSGVF